MSSVLAGQPTPAQAALDLAFAASSFDGSPQGSSLFALAVELGASLDACAAAFASCSAPALLEEAFALGADPAARVHLATLAARDPIPSAWGFCSESPPGLADRVLLAQSAGCAQVLARHGASPLAEWVHPDEQPAAFAPALSHFLARGITAPAWDTLAALLDGSKPRPKQAQALAERCLASAASSFSNASNDVLATATAALGALEALRAAGANFASCPPRHESLAQTLWSAALESLATIGDDPASVPATKLLERFASQSDPGNFRDRFRAILRAVSLNSPGSLSKLPAAPLLAALRQSAVRIGAEAHGEPSAATALLEWASRGLPTLVATQGTPGRRTHTAEEFRRGDATLSWLTASASAWTAPQGADLDRALDLMAHCMCMAGLLFSAPYAHGRPEQWDQWIAGAEPLAQGQLGLAAHPLACAQLAASSHPALAAAYERVAPLATQLARLAVPADAASAVVEAAQLAARSPLAPPGRPPPRM